MAFHKINDPERLHALIDAMLLIETDADLDGLLSRIIETASRLVGARYGALGVIARDGITLSRFITYGLDLEQRAAIGPEPQGRGLLGEIIRRRTTLRIDDLSGHIMSSGFPANHPPMHRFLGVPVITGDGHIFGNLYLTDPVDGEAFSEEDEQLTEAFGHATGLVIDQQLLRSNVRALTLAEERERLARDLHDTVIQRLFGAGLALRNSLPAIAEDDVRERIEDVLDELDMTIQEIRTTIFEIDQDHFFGQSLEDRVTTLSLEIASGLGVSAKVKVAANIDANVGPRCTQNCLQALREILSNVVRHSSATEVDIELDIDDALIEVIVRDNGVGFTPNVGSGGGVRNLSARARELGGNCSIDSRIGGGTTVRWTANRSF
ncbi:MAG TPA: GAF domain-containing protein [Acidimicrobiales bacterium]|nr:GAF domain-containing protein [Acidimicrobiales bacterium]